METSKPMPYEQSFPGSERVEAGDSLPSPIESGGSEVPESEEAAIVKEAEFAKQAIKKRPEAVLAHVEEAAKKDKAQEALYELRHEIKDEAAQPMVTVGSVVAELPKRQPAAAKAEQYISKNPTAVLSESGDLPRIEEDAHMNVFKMYKRPMVIGFTVAMAGLGIFIIYSLITR